MLTGILLCVAILSNTHLLHGQYTANVSVGFQATCFNHLKCSDRFKCCQTGNSSHEELCCDLTDVRHANINGNISGLSCGVTQEWRSCDNNRQDDKQDNKNKKRCCNEEETVCCYPEAKEWWRHFEWAHHVGWIVGTVVSVVVLICKCYFLKRAKRKETGGAPGALPQAGGELQPPVLQQYPIQGASGGAASYPEKLGGFTPPSYATTQFSYPPQYSEVKAHPSQ